MIMSKFLNQKKKMKNDNVRVQMCLGQMRIPHSIPESGVTSQRGPKRSQNRKNHIAVVCVAMINLYSV